MRAPFVAAVILALIGAAACFGTAVHEYFYYQDHPFRTGVSGVLVWLAAGAALGCLVVAVVASAVGKDLHVRSSDLGRRVLQ